MVKVTNEFSAAQERWLTALESGEYIQNIGALKGITKLKECFCVLGVGYDISKDEIKSSREKLSLYVIKDINGYTNFVSTGTVDPDFLEYYDLVINNNLIEMNDTFKISLENIAKIIRKSPYMYFLNFNENYKP